MAYTALPFESADDGGIQTEHGTLLSPAGRAFYVHSSGGRATDPTNVRNRTYTNLNDALRQCTANSGDTVFVLPGHTENVGASAMGSLQAGTSIIGLGNGNARPQFTWNLAGSSWAVAVNNVLLKNLILLMEPGTGTVTVTAPMTITGTGFGMVNCRVRTSTDANNKATVPILFSDGATDAYLINNRIIGATAGESTTLVDIAGADRLVMKGNLFKGASSNTGVGVVRFKATAAVDMWLEGNVYINKKAASTCAVTGVASTSGVSINEHFAYLDTSSLTPWLTSTGLMTFHRPTVTNTAGEVGTEVVGTVSA